MHLSRLSLSLAVVVVAGAGLSSRPPALRANDGIFVESHASGSQRDSTVLRLRAAVDSFVRTWRYAWEVSDRYRDLAVVTGATQLLTRTAPAKGVVASEAWPPPPGIDMIVLTPEESSAVILSTRGTIASSELPRQGLLHCHPFVERNSMFERYDELIIVAGVGKRAICPSWYSKNKPLPWDESKGMDNSLVLPVIPRIREMRALLLMMLDDGVRALPRDPWIAGQRVRFALDQGDTAHAAKAVTECRAAKWWCTALSGYLSHTRGRIAEADSTFLVMLKDVPATQRCGWTDYGVLFDDEDVKQYYKMSCAARDSIAEKLWWLTDPEYGDDINERRATHFARRVLYELRSSTSYHERWEMGLAEMGPAMFEMLVRYGWPSVSIWGGMAEDRNHYGYLNIGNPETWNHGRFATAEYSQPRAHSVPTLQAVLDPMRSGETDWVLTDSAFKVMSQSMKMWWPIEHFERAAGPMVQVWSQHGLFRRQDSVMLPLATSYPPEDFSLPKGDSLRGTLFLATAPGVQRTFPRSAVVGQPNLTKTFVGSTPQLLSLELHNTATGVLGRTRFGVAPPQPLNVLAPREIAMSAPVFIRPPTAEEVRNDTPEAALARMYSTTRFDNISTIGLYSETYGFAAADTAVLTVRFIRNEKPASGIFGRFIRGFREAKADVLVKREEIARPSMFIPSGPVPIVGRVVTVDISELEPGDYTVIVGASRPGGAETTGEAVVHLLSVRRR